MAQALTVEEASRVLGVSESTVWRMIRRGALPSVRKKGRRLIPRRALHASASGRQSASIPPFDESHPMFRLVGAARGGKGRPGARQKHAILDE